MSTAAWTGTGEPPIGSPRLAAAERGGDVPESLKLAVVFLTRLPLRLESPPPLAAAMPWFPVVGALLGLVAGAVFAGLTLLAMPSLPASLVVLAVLVIATGALHEDGLADCADGLGPHDRARRLEVMRDSRIGSFGVMALILVTLARLAGLAALWAPWMQVTTLVVVAAASRATMVALLATLPPARGDGLGADAGSPHAVRVGLALLVPAVLAVALLGPGPALVLLATAAVVTAIWAWLARRCFGGQTGDVLGAGQQLVEAGMLLAVTVLR
jgi:adenosylcobinamide-GDP ribazoletransferase